MGKTLDLSATYDPEAVRKAARERWQALEAGNEREVEADQNESMEKEHDRALEKGRDNALEGLDEDFSL